MSPELSQAELTCLRDIRSGADALGIPIMLVGANARRLTFDLPNDLPQRTTLDWDFAVRVPSWDQFHRLRDSLLDTTFRPGPLEHRLVHKGTQIGIDLIPFGSLESDGRIRWPHASTEMDVIAFQDAYEHVAELDLAPGLRLAAAAPPLLIALKLLAFADRKGQTDRDVQDLWHMMQNYLTPAQQGRLWEEPIASGVPESFDWEYGGPFLIGVDLASACKRPTVERLKPIISELAEPYSSYIQPLIGITHSQEEEERQRQKVSTSFSWLLRGLESGIGQASGR